MSLGTDVLFNREKRYHYNELAYFLLKKCYICSLEKPKKNHQLSSSEHPLQPNYGLQIAFLTKELGFLEEMDAYRSETGNT